MDTEVALGDTGDKPAKEKRREEARRSKKRKEQSIEKHRMAHRVSSIHGFVFAEHHIFFFFFVVLRIPNLYFYLHIHSNDTFLFACQQTRTNKVVPIL